MMKRLIAALLIASLLCCTAMADTPAQFLGKLQDCHKVTSTYKDTTQKNKSVVRLWTLKTALPEVDEELAEIAQEYVDQIAPELPKAKNKTTQNSRLDVEIRYQRTGLSWMSFLVQARTTYHRKTTDQQITSRVFDMETGNRILLTDLFDEDSEGWSLLAEAVAETVNTYFPDDLPDDHQLQELCRKENLENLDFSLMGMSLVLHIPAQDFYPDHHSLMEVILYYPQIRPYMTEEAQKQTDNLSYYKTCALTLDDGPVRVNTTRTLNTLLQHGLVATFFCIGNRVSSFEDLVQREHDAGNRVASHNWHHGDVRKSSPAALRAMVEKCNDAWNKAIGIIPPYDRVPKGLYNQMINAKVNWSYIQWSLDTYDWRGLSVSTIVNTVRSEISDGDIILCHDIKENTSTAVGQFADILAEHGYLFLTVDELMAKDDVTMEKGKVYYRCINGETGRK